ncbi:MAG: class I SAM-dependent methyltransferase [Thermomicrobiales bacterium]|nr:class I SAM-dependent methyltransferase [Thermomicrobiales bacterium]MCO5217826.1 class I SAM-dependent methyltransferase [Thermomicrobiales bacterium]MCO5227479.1 class I SAM-dependent methyltransferase [Thermomicrobiales bacterium]
MLELPRHHVIRESSHRVINPFTPEKLRQLGEALFLQPDWMILDLACGKGEMLCTWSATHGVGGHGVDISSDFIAAAMKRAVELGVENRVSFEHGNAEDYVSAEPVDLACCMGATWIGDGVPGTIEQLRKSLRPGGIMLVGHPYWLKPPPDQVAITACGAEQDSDWLALGDLIEQMQSLGCDVIEMMLADQDSWDRYVAAQWRNIRAFLDANPDDELAPFFREELTRSPLDHVRYQREYLGWGVFVLKDR